MCKPLAGQELFSNTFDLYVCKFCTACEMLVAHDVQCLFFTAAQRDVDVRQPAAVVWHLCGVRDLGFRVYHRTVMWSPLLTWKNQQL